VGVAVKALRVRAEAGDRLSSYEYARTTYADDRGIYRIYGLAAGGYVVSACGTQPFALAFTVYDADAPTFYPASTRAEATVVAVRAGEEVRGVDIRHRGAASHSISGTISGAGAKNRYANVVVASASDGQIVMTANARRGGEPLTFEVPGVADGEYTVRARSWSDEPIESAPRRVVVKGADVTGVTLTLEPLGTIEGSVVVDAPAAERACGEAQQERSKQETVVSLVPEVPQSGDAARRVVQRDTAPGRDDTFSFKGVPLARYRFDVRPPNDDWYVAAIRQQKGAAKSAVVDLGREGVRVASGERITGVTVEMSRGAAKASGKVEAPEGGALPDGLVVHLVPAGAADAENVLRYREMKIARDGEFAFAGVAPGKYWLLARPAPEPDPARPAPSRAAWRADTRAALRRDAAKAGHTIELAPCQRTERVGLPLSP
jgi:hypothetical protein